jgi:hypothetical protein
MIFFCDLSRGRGAADDLDIIAADHMFSQKFFEESSIYPGSAQILLAS